MTLQKLVQMLRHSTLVTNITEGEVPKEHLNYTDEELQDLVSLTYPVVDPTIVIDGLTTEIPDLMAYLIILLCKKEIYYRMATGDARHYPLGAEGASLRKDYIFEHYMSLIRAITNDFTQAYESWQRNKKVSVSNLKRARYHLGYDVKVDSVPPILALSIDSTVSELKLSWDRFSKDQGYFWKYQIIVHDSQIYDEYKNEIVLNPVKSKIIYDITQVKTVINDLAVGTYKVALVTYLTNGVRGVAEQEITIT